MGEAILRNLKSKTGKTLDEWLAIAEASPATSKKDLAAYLKSEHHLGHFQAQKVAEAYVGENPYGDAEALVGTLFGTPEQRAAYTRWSAAIRALGEDVHSAPCRTYVPFGRERQFAALYPGADGLSIGLRLAEVPASLQNDSNRGSAQLNARLDRPWPAEVDDEALVHLRAAYANARRDG